MNWIFTVPESVDFLEWIAILILRQRVHLNQNAVSYMFFSYFMKQVSSLKDDLLLKTKQNKKANKQTNKTEVRLRPEFQSLYYTSALEGTSRSVFFRLILKRNKKKE